MATNTASKIGMRAFLLTAGLAVAACGAAASASTLGTTTSRHAVIQDPDNPAARNYMPQPGTVHQAVVQDPDNPEARNYVPQPAVRPAIVGDPENPAWRFYIAPAVEQSDTTDGCQANSYSKC